MTINNKKLGQIFLVFAVLLNGLVLAVNLKLTGLEEDLQTKRFEESYFMVIEQTKANQSLEYSILQGNSNQLVLLRRLADNRLTPTERNTLKNNVKELNRQSQDKKVKMLAVTYLLANDPPEGTNVYKMFEGKSDAELGQLQVKYEMQAMDYSDKLKKQMVQLMDKITFWGYIHSAALSLSSIILILGSILIFREAKVGRNQ